MLAAISKIASRFWIGALRMAEAHLVQPSPAWMPRAVAGVTLGCLLALPLLMIAMTTRGGMTITMAQVLVLLACGWAWLKALGSVLGYAVDAATE